MTGLQYARGHTSPRSARLIGLDWGTTSCRAYLIDGRGQVIDSVDGGLGVLALSAEQDGAAGFDRQLNALVGDWLGANPELPMVACGMVGSDQGWSVAPYKNTPVDLLGTSLLPLTMVATTLGPLHIVPGLLSRGEETGLPNVMRGEETQILGALPDTARNKENIVILPGTHSKWARLKGFTVTNFETSMTGEIYALLLQHSILGRSVSRSEEQDQTAFNRGLDIVFGDAGDPSRGDTNILSTLFSARTLPMLGRLEPSAVPDYISGLLIGTEVAGFVNRWHAETADNALPTVTICANNTLAGRYASALLRSGSRALLATGTPAAAGLWRIAVHTGLTKKVTP